MAAAPLSPRAAPRAESVWPSKPFIRFLATQALALQRLKTRAQFQAVLASVTVARSEHFALHCKLLTVRAPAFVPLTSPSFDAACFVASAPLSPALIEHVGDPTSGVADMFRGADLWLGAMVPKRWAKRAVTRNAIKRQIYSVSADFSPTEPSAAFVVRLRRDFSRKVYLSASSDRLKHDVRMELLTLMHTAARPV